jgi:hypothetical protein
MQHQLEASPMFIVSSPAFLSGPRLSAFEPANRKLVGADVGASPFDLISSLPRIFRSKLPFRFRYRNDAPSLYVDACLPE